MRDDTGKHDDNHQSPLLKMGQMGKKTQGHQFDQNKQSPVLEQALSIAVQIHAHDSKTTQTRQQVPGMKRCGICIKKNSAGVSSNTAQVDAPENDVQPSLAPEGSGFSRKNECFDAHCDNGVGKETERRDDVRLSEN